MAPGLEGIREPVGEIWTGAEGSPRALKNPAPRSARGVGVGLELARVVALELERGKGELGGVGVTAQRRPSSRQPGRRSSSSTGARG